MCRYRDEYYEYADEFEDKYADGPDDESLEYYYDDHEDDDFGGYTEADFGCEEEYLEYLEWGDD